jgi:peptidoglycan/LPS O-acetylase OafA/YrhL
MTLRPLIPGAGTTGRRLPGIEGLRAVAAGAVVIHHVWIFDGGIRVGEDSGADVVFLNLALGVTLFFALSGFLLYRPFAAAIARDEALPSVGRYLRNRALRILPAYWAILLVAALVLTTAATRAGGGEIGYGSMTDPVELLKAMLLIQNYDPDSIVIGIGPAWSLSVEVVFYLLLPLLVIGAARLAVAQERRERRVLVLLAPAALLLAIGIAGKVLAGVVVTGSPAEGYSDNWHSVIERSFLAQADLFSFGMAAAVLHTEVVDGRLRLPRWWRGAALAGAVALFVPCALSLNRGQLSYLPENTVVALAATLFLAAAVFPAEAGARPFWLQRLLELRPVVATGLISYSIFLWNVPVVLWLTEHDLTREGWSGLGFNLILTFLIVGALSVLTYRLVELPALRRKRRPEPIETAQLEAAP